MTAAEFYTAYCERSHTDPDTLAVAGRRAYRCSCGDEICDGWVMLPADMVEEDRAGGYPTFGISADDPGYAPEVAA